MKIKTPPAVILRPFAKLAKDHPDNIEEYMSFARATLPDGRWLHYDQLVRRWPNNSDHRLMWSLVKIIRATELHPLLELGAPSRISSFKLTSVTQRAISLADQKTTDAQLTSMLEKIGEKAHLKFLADGLIEDEAISSSQLEGAVTTVKIAKELIKSHSKGKTVGDKMIIGNLQMMNFMWQKREEKLSLDLMTQLHKIGTEGIDDNHYKPAIFRYSDDVVLEDANHNTLHQPPPSKDLQQRLQKIIIWMNENHHEKTDNDYIHPLIKAITLHFCIGYEHPFYDGNGRVARALFYWYMFKHGFSGFRYISISQLLKEAPVQYAKSYLHTETDDLDLTYFIDYQCSIIARAIQEFESVYNQTRNKILQFNEFLIDSGVYKQLKEKEKTLLRVAKSGIATTFTAQDVARNLDCSENTALTSLNRLAALNIFNKSKIGKNYIFKMNDTETIINNWSN